MSGIVVGNRVMLQDESGQFMHNIDGKAREAVWEVTRDIAKLAFYYAPYRTGRLRRSIDGYMTGPMEGVVTVTAPYAGVMEEGSNKKNYPIGADGQTLFKGAQEGIVSGGQMGRAPDSFGPVKGPVIHPGVEGTHFLKRAYARVREDAPEIFRRHLAG